MIEWALLDMPLIENVIEWFKVDLLRGFFALVGALALAYLFALAKNLADPTKRHPSHVRGLLTALVVLLVCVGSILFKDSRCPKCDQKTMNLEEYRDCLRCNGSEP